MIVQPSCIKDFSLQVRGQEPLAIDVPNFRWIKAAELYNSTFVA